MTREANPPDDRREPRTITVVVRGHRGRMGIEACAAIEASDDVQLVGTIGRDDDMVRVLESTRPDVCVDLTTPHALDAFEAALPRALPHCGSYVIGTSGVDDDRRARLAAILGTDDVVLVVPNFCIGSVLLQRFAAEAATFLTDVEITETHHERKVDSPSGTAIETAQRVARARRPGAVNKNTDAGPARGMRIDGVPVHSLRLPGVLARQLVEFGGEGELLTLRHDTLSRSAFMPGLLRSIRRVGRLHGLLLGLEHVLD
ncbi:MAG: 4-hydroxy-tetrahydrodipicolinate reductase [Planctomycetes bacterium]|nr:4-hydroxy-tetrahydrodipicolinate reductase [Planctomycetota bacterium]